MMAELLGINTRYRQHEVAFAATHLADHARHDGVCVSMRADGACMREVAPYWDSRVRHKVGFVEWVTNCDRVLWTRCPAPALVDAVRDYGIETWILAVWDELQGHDIHALQNADVVIYPYRCVGDVLKGHGAAWQVVELPWAVPVPPTPHPAREPAELLQRTRLAVPLFDSQPSRVDSRVFALLAWILDSMPHTEVVIGRGRQWRRVAARALRAMQKHYGPRVQVVTRPTYMERIRFYADADVTIWPASYEGLALAGLWSVAMGTPVIAWDVPPQTEYLRQMRNSYLIPCDLEYNWLGVPEVVVDMPRFYQGVVTLLQDAPLLGRIQQTTTDGVSERQACFAAGWKQLRHGR